MAPNRGLLAGGQAQSAWQGGVRQQSLRSFQIRFDQHETASFSSRLVLDISGILNGIYAVFSLTMNHQEVTNTFLMKKKLELIIRNLFSPQREVVTLGELMAPLGVDDIFKVKEALMPLINKNPTKLILIRNDLRLEGTVDELDFS